MNTFLILLFNLTFIFNGLVCAGQNAKNNDELPDTRPERFSIQYFLSGGMLYYSENMYISQDSCVYTVNDEGTISKTHFNMTGSELDAIYKIFKDNNFDKIKTREEMVYDRGGEGISLSWGQGKYVNIDDGGMTFIEKNWEKEWSACLSALKSSASEKMDKQKLNYEIRIDKSLFGKIMSIYIKQEKIIPESTVMAESELENYITKTARLLPGMYRMEVSYDKRYETIQINSDSTKGINLYLKNDSLLTYSYIK
jgi:hypothetical protein